MRSLTSTLCTVVAVGLLAGCSGLGATNSSLPGIGSQSQRVHNAKHVPLSLIPPGFVPAGMQRLHLDVPPLKKTKSAGLIYASEFYGEEVYGYPNPNSKNKSATCTLGTSSNYLEYVNGFGTDSAGDTMIPALTPASADVLYINVFKPNCGALAWSTEVTSGQAADAYTNAKSAVTGSILVGLLADPDNNDYGAAVICSAKSGCGTPITNSSITGYAAGVAMATDGDCWISGATDETEGFVLAYFKGCTGSGEVATGTKNADYGGLFFDTKGNLASVDGSGMLYVYSGCNPKCKVVSTSKLEGESFFGGLDSKGTSLALGDYENGTVDVYSYSTTKGAKYSYSFSKGLVTSDMVETGQFAPGLKKT
jgi:hypothetical protein